MIVFPFSALQQREERLATRRAEVEHLLAQQKQVREREQELQAEKARLSALLDEALKQSSKKHARHSSPTAPRKLRYPAEPSSKEESVRSLSTVTNQATPMTASVGMLSGDLETAADSTAPVESLDTLLVTEQPSDDSIPEASSMDTAPESSLRTHELSTAHDETVGGEYDSETFEEASSAVTASVRSATSSSLRSCKTVSERLTPRGSGVQREPRVAGLPEISSSESVCGKSNEQDV